MPVSLNKLLSQKDKIILFAGIGNLLKMDDGVGVFISSRIIKTPTIIPLNAEVSIENYIGKINSLNPDILVIIDCADIKLKPGSFRLLPVDSTEDMTFNTHNISLKRLSDFFRMPVFILGIQPEKVDFGEFLSYIVKKTADKIIKQINNKKEVCHG